MPASKNLKKLTNKNMTKITWTKITVGNGKVFGIAPHLILQFAEDKNKALKLTKFAVRFLEYLMGK